MCAFVRVALFWTKIQKLMKLLFSSLVCGGGGGRKKVWWREKGSICGDIFRFLLKPNSQTRLFRHFCTGDFVDSVFEETQSKLADKGEKNSLNLYARVVYINLRLFSIAYVFPSISFSLCLCVSFWASKFGVCQIQEKFPLEWNRDLNLESIDL